MGQLIRHNWPYKIMALAVAIILHVYVRGQQNSVHSTLYLPITITPAPGQRVVEPPPGTQITVDLDGPAEVVRKLSSDDVKVSVNSADLKPGQTTRQQISVEIPEKYRKQGVDVHWRPSSVGVKVVSDASREVPVVAEPVNHPEGWQLRQAPAVTPARVTVSGPQAEVGRVVSVTAPFTLDPSEQVNTVSKDLRAVDEDGAAISTVRIDPAQVLVSGMLERVVLQKRVPVQPVFRVPPGARVTVTVVPPQVHVIGPERVLADLYLLETQPIELPPGQSNVSVDAPLVVPQEKVRVAPDRVRVTLRVQPGAGKPAPAQPRR